MSATAFLDACGWVPTSGGTGAWTVSVAIQGYQTLAAAATAQGVASGATLSYRAESADKSQWEEGFGASGSSNTTLARSTITANSSGGTTAINFSAAPNVFITALSADLQNAALLTGGALPAARITFAAKADQVTATSTTLPVNPAVQQNHPSSAKAWVTFVGATGVISDSFNVASVTRSSAGNYVVTFTTAFTTANYVGVIGFNGGSAVIGRTLSATASAATINTLNTSFTAADPTNVLYAAFGTQ